MKRGSGSFLRKIAAVVLFVIFSGVSAVGVFLSAICADKGFFNISAELREIIANRAPVSSEYLFYSRLFEMRYVIVVGTVAAVLLTIAVFVILMCMAGHNSKYDGIHLNAIDKIPLDLYTAITAIACAVVCGLMLMAAEAEVDILKLAYWGVLGVIVELFALEWCMSVSARIKAGHIFRNTLIYSFFVFIGKLFGKIADGIRYVFDNMRVLGKCILGFAAYTILNAILFALMYMGVGYSAVFWIYLNAALLVVICILAVGADKLLKSAELMARGNLNLKINSGKMFGAMRRHAENLNNINVGITKAVDEKLRQERFKTELITNVSHDIKTPLTSIINYADLISKEKCENENIKEYAEALERAAIRLKRVTEDIVEASKAATGNIKASIAETNVTELLNQSVAEYSDKLSQNGLEVIVSVPELSAMTDGKLMWRVFDNLLNNICKYSQTSTRVFIDAYEDSANVYVTFKNISRDILNIRPDELMERFVRGDSSRNSEGSGLGLSIAKSLTEICGGKFEIAIDGDMFKATVSMKK